ncbi:hypothetical protein IMG5_185530 [Ichthyophthirius multifiliis]|uniref:Protein YIPF n=1 Tax=Ichthyophthirius multifiliis TaxID=5932 RepID=G0R3I1_ICHMU|nr:hypothetical protein IMG5_185530 [Ichthyophthirius multifiliis]EGR27970.1 hypothetical protein IMG5_185530 [Ichthyophthirius multifiliis]|eukprot:XP_004027315.1 hypothetical protein IMG5_185530 [Ichthyophthirius multifiliis]
MDYKIDNDSGYDQPQDLYGPSDNSQIQYSNKQVDIEYQKQNSTNETNDIIRFQMQKQQLGICGFLQLEYYQPYFNITSNEIKQRVKSCFLPIKPDFLNIIKQKPDLWGPFWILTTLIFMLYSCGNLSQYISEKNNYKVNFSYLPVAAAIVYSFGIGFPIVLCILIKFFGGDVSVFEIICLYGYSMGCFIIVAVFNMIPLYWMKVLSLVYGLLNSSIFIVMNILGQIQDIGNNKKYIILGLIGCCQLGLMLTFLLYFFKQS